MCAIQKPFQRKKSSNNSKSGITVPPSANDAISDTATEIELRRLRSLYGRRSTILTPSESALGRAPTAPNNLLGS